MDQYKTFSLRFLSSSFLKLPLKMIKSNVNKSIPSVEVISKIHFGILLSFMWISSSISIMGQIDSVYDIRKDLLRLEGNNRISENLILRERYLSQLPADFDPDLTVDLRTVDTSIYSPLYTLLNETPVALKTRFEGVDANQDGRKEFYGFYKSYEDPKSYFVIYEINSDGSFDSVYRYSDSLGYVWRVVDLDNDSNFEAVNGGLSSPLLGWHLIILTTDSLTGYPTKYQSFYDPSTGTGQPVKVNFYDIDSDSFPEMIYYFAGPGDSLILDNSDQIAEYDRTNKKFELVYQNHPQTYYTAGHSFGDFDSDSKQNFSKGSISGEIFVYEHITGNNYEIRKIDSLPAKHAYMATFTDDLDLNGKPEIWIGAETYINGVGSTVLFLYETRGDNIYEVVYTIAIIGVISFYASNMLHADFDNDGTDEVLVCIDQHVLIFKKESNGYQLYYIKRNEYMNLNSVYDSAVASDLDSDGYPEIIITMDLVENNKIRLFSRIYKKTTTLGIEEENIDMDYRIEHPYPNPFNPLVNIEFTSQRPEHLTVSIYDVLGREIEILLDEFINAGQHFLNWNGTDKNGNSVSSGIYLIKFKSSSLQKTIKTLLLK